MSRGGDGPARFPAPYGLSGWIALVIGIEPAELVRAERAAGLGEGRLRRVLRGEDRLTPEEALRLAEARREPPAIFVSEALADLHPNAVEALQPAWSGRLAENEEDLLAAARAARTDGPPMTLDVRDRVAAAMIRALNRADGG